jgi:hypothetical protein
MEDIALETRSKTRRGEKPGKFRDVLTPEQRRRFDKAWKEIEPDIKRIEEECGHG